jgi:FtsP/CotA-like multicopper oxidase with cupredoxin domain
MHLSPRLSFALLVGLTGLVLVPSPHRPPPPRLADNAIAANDNRKPAGSLAGNVLTVHIEAKPGTFYPEGTSGVGVPAFGFAELGKQAQSPGPLIRVKVGTTVKAMVHNSLAKPLTIYGLAKARGFKDSIVIAPGKSANTEFVATTPGTYWYAGQTVPGPMQAGVRINEDGQLNGVIVVDPPGAVMNDRIFLISWWFIIDSTSKSGLGRGTMTINGLAWPHTERLDAAQNDSLHWRVVNTTPIDHPMHLHGFYYRVDAKGDGVRDTVLAPADRRMTVTEIVLPGQTMLMTWSPTRPGNWIFHCHFAGHLSHHVAMDTEKGMPHPEKEQSHMSADAPHQMYGLVMGHSGRSARCGGPGAGQRPPDPSPGAREGQGLRRPPGLRLRPRRHAGGEERVDAAGARSRDRARAQPAGSDHHRESGEGAGGRALARHRATELSGWRTGMERRGQGDSARDQAGRFADGALHPPRAGTFMYHSHFNEFKQITSGLYGPIIVLEPGQKYDPETDRVLMFSDGGPTTNVLAGPFPPMFMNGKAQPDPIDLKAGTKYRFRVIGITGDLPVEFKFAAAGKPTESGERWHGMA